MPGASMHSPWLVTVVQDPVQTVPALVLQYVTVTEAAESVCWKRGFRRAAKGSPIKVISEGSCASTHAFISARETMPVCVF